MSVSNAHLLAVFRKLEERIAEIDIRQGGPIGPRGPSGAKGRKGEKGAQGPIGPKGDSGPQGAKGPTGATGPAGKDGKDGKPGPQGPAGRDGTSGRDGIDGTDGLDGVSVVDASIDFDGYLRLVMSDGTEIEAGQVTLDEVAQQIVYNAGGGIPDEYKDRLDKVIEDLNDHLNDFDNPHQTSLENLIDTEINVSPVLKEGQGLWYDADSGLWKNRVATLEAWPTGLANGGELNIGPGVNDIEVIAGFGIITDSYTDPQSPPAEVRVEWTQFNEAITAAPAQAGSVVWFSIANSGNPATPPEVGGIPTFLGTLKQYPTSPSPSLARAEIFLGVAIHNGVEWKEVSNPKVINQTAETLRELVTAVLPLTTIISGGEITEQVNFELNQAEGVVWENNRNWHVDKSNPNRETLPAALPISFQYVNADFSNVGAPTSTVDPSQYTPAPGTGAPVAVPGAANITTIQRLYLDPANNYWMLWGQETYPNFEVAQANLYAEVPTVPFILQNSILLGFVVAEKAKLDWDVDEAVFISNQGAGGTSGGGTPITEFINLSDTPPTYTSFANAVPTVNLAENALEFSDRVNATTFIQGNQYYTQDMVFEDGWLMVANKNTLDDPVPQPAGPPTWALPDVPAFGTFSNVSVVESGHLYTLTEAGYYQGLRVWVPAVGPDITYRVTVVVAGRATTIDDPLLVPGQWNVLDVNQTLFPSGSQILITISALNSGTSVQPGDTPADWNRAVSSNTAVPVAGEWNTNVQETLLRIHEQSFSPVNIIDLTGVVPGSTFQFVDIGDPNRSITFLALSPETFAGGVYSWDVAIQSVGTNGPPQPGDQTLTTIEVPVAAATEFVGINAYWNTNTEPAWATVQSALEYDGVPQAVVGDEAYGIDLLFQPLVASPDWDFYGLPSSAGGGGGGGDVENLGDLGDVTLTAPTNTEVLKYNGTQWVNAQVDYSEITNPPTIVNDHGGLSGLGDDDHTQYHNDARGDIRYYLRGEVDTLLDGKVAKTGDTMTGRLDIVRAATLQLLNVTSGNASYIDFQRAGVTQGEIRTNGGRFRIRSIGSNDLEIESAAGRQIEFFPATALAGGWSATGQFFIGPDATGADANADDAIIKGAGNVGMSIISTDADAAPALRFRTSSGEKMIIDGSTPALNGTGQRILAQDGLLFGAGGYAEAGRITSAGIWEGIWNDFGARNTNSKFQKLTQAQYDSITPDANTIYFIVG